MAGKIKPFTQLIAFVPFVSFVIQPLGGLGDSTPWRPWRFIPLPIILLSVLLTGCGKMGEPLPPIPRAPLIIDELKVEQEGAQLVLSFPLTRTRQSQRIQRIDVYRLIESATDPLGLPVDSYSARAAIIASIPADRIPLSRSTITYADPLDLKAAPRDARYRYAVRLINQAGAAADFSNYATIAPLFEVALAPTDLIALQREKEIEIAWKPPTANAAGTTSLNLAGYNLYRRAGAGDAAPIKLNNGPLKEPRYLDRDFQFGLDYEYIARSLSLPPGVADPAGAIESDESQVLKHRPLDTFPPAAPTSLTIASINKIVSLFWPLNAEPDVAGYNIYRAEDERTPPEQWRKLNAQPHQTASYRDEKVVVGQQYFYRITAVDRAGNESPRSAIVSEIVAP